MTFDPNHEEHLRELQQELHRAHAITSAINPGVIARACPRLQAQRLAASTTVIRLIESGAFADAALALLDLELPQWKLRRLIREDDEWHCSLSKQLGLPAEFDEMAEATHESLPLAILIAFVEARHRSFTAGEARPTSVPQIQPAQGYAICCDNFA